MIKAKGTILRIMARWHEEGEKSAKYFANLKKRNLVSKHITELRIAESEITEPKEILKQGAAYYHNLYSSNKTDIEDSKYKVFFDLPKGKKLSKTDKQLLEDLLTETECKNALEYMKNAKSPGVDGLTVEFYKAFRDKHQT